MEEIETLALDSGKHTVAQARLESRERDFHSVPGGLIGHIEVVAPSILSLGGKLSPRDGELAFVQSTLHPAHK